MNGKMLEKSAGIDMVEVSYKGGTEVPQDVKAGKYQRKPPLPFVPGTEAAGRGA